MIRGPHPLKFITNRGVNLTHVPQLLNLDQVRDYIIAILSNMLLKSYLDLHIEDLDAHFDTSNGRNEKEEFIKEILSKMDIAEVLLRLNDKTDKTDFYIHINNNLIHTNKEEKEKWNDKLEGHNLTKGFIPVVKKDQVTLKNIILKDSVIESKTIDPSDFTKDDIYIKNNLYINDQRVGEIHLVDALPTEFDENDLYFSTNFSKKGITLMSLYKNGKWNDITYIDKVLEEFASLTEEELEDFKDLLDKEKITKITITDNSNSNTDVKTTIDYTNSNLIIVDGSTLTSKTKTLTFDFTNISENRSDRRLIIIKPVTSLIRTIFKYNNIEILKNSDNDCLIKDSYYTLYRNENSIYIDENILTEDIYIDNLDQLLSTNFDLNELINFNLNLIATESDFINRLGNFYLNFPKYILDNITLTPYVNILINFSRQNNNNSIQKLTIVDSSSNEYTYGRVIQGATINDWKRWYYGGENKTNRIFIQETEPKLPNDNPKIGDFWYQLDSTILGKVINNYRYLNILNIDQWIKISSEQINYVNISDTEPLNPIIGSLWFKYRGNGTSISNESQYIELYGVYTGSGNNNGWDYTIKGLSFIRDTQGGRILESYTNDNGVIKLVEPVNALKKLLTADYVSSDNEYDSDNGNELDRVKIELNKQGATIIGGTINLNSLPEYTIIEHRSNSTGNFKTFFVKINSTWEVIEKDNLLTYSYENITGSKKDFLGSVLYNIIANRIEAKKKSNIDIIEIAEIKDNISKFDLTKFNFKIIKNYK